MRSYAPAEITHLQARAGVRPRLLVWIVAKDRETGDPFPVGFWNGDDTEEFTIAAAARSYNPTALLGMDDITFETGLKVRRISIWLATAAPEVIAAVQGYDVRLAPIEVHRVLTDPLTHRPIAAPHRIWKGWVDGAPRVTPAKGLSRGRVSITAASAAMALTRGLPGRYSDEAMRLRGGDDRLFRYADISGKVPIYWGEKRVDTAPGKDSGGVGSVLGGGQT